MSGLSKPLPPLPLDCAGSHQRQQQQQQKQKQQNYRKPQNVTIKPQTFVHRKKLVYVLQVEEDDEAMVVEPLALPSKSRPTQRPTLKLQTSLEPQQGLRPQPALMVPPARRVRPSGALSRSSSAPPTPRSQNSVQLLDKPPSRSPSATTRPVNCLSRSKKEASYPTNPPGHSASDAVSSTSHSRDEVRDSTLLKTSAISRAMSDAGYSTGHSSYSSSRSDHSKASDITRSTSLTSTSPGGLRLPPKSRDPFVSPVESNLTPKIRQLVGAGSWPANAAVSPVTNCSTPLSSSLPCSPMSATAQYPTIKTVEDLSLPPKLRQLIGLRDQGSESSTPWASTPKLPTVDDKRIPKSPASVKSKSFFSLASKEPEAGASPTSVYSQTSQASAHESLLYQRRRRSAQAPLSPLPIVNEEHTDNQADDDMPSRLDELVHSPGFAKIQPQDLLKQQSGQTSPVTVQMSPRDIKKKRASQALGLQVYHDWASELAKSPPAWDMEGFRASPGAAAPLPPPPPPPPPQVSVTPRNPSPMSSPKQTLTAVSNRVRNSSATRKLPKSPARKPSRSSEAESRARGRGGGGGGGGDLQVPKKAAGSRSSAMSSFSLRSKKPAPQISVFDEDSDSETDTLAAFGLMVRSVGGRKPSTASPPTSPTLLQNLFRGVRRRAQSDNHGSRQRSKSRPGNGPRLVMP